MDSAKYLEKLSNRYLNGEDVTATLPEVTGDILTRWIEWEFENLPKDLVIEFTEKPDNYGANLSMFDDIRKNKHLFVFSGFCEHPLISPRTNMEFRAIHDVRHHLEGNSEEFDLLGELSAWLKACDDLFKYLWFHESVLTLEIYPVLKSILFSEIVLQAAVRLQTGSFAEQKIVF